jgi:hypothetical protein
LGVITSLCILAGRAMVPALIALTISICATALLGVFVTGGVGAAFAVGQVGVAIFGCAALAYFLRNEQRMDKEQHG